MAETIRLASAEVFRDFAVTVILQGLRLTPDVVTHHRARLSYHYIMFSGDGYD